MKIYDCFQFFDENMMLDLRLNILNSYVDKFVIVENRYIKNIWFYIFVKMSIIKLHYNFLSKYLPIYIPEKDPINANITVSIKLYLPI